MSKNEKHNVSLGTLYDFNKQMVLKQGLLSKAEIKEIKPKLIEWFTSSAKKYAMLLCRERYDFTVFQLHSSMVLNSPQIATEELIEVLKNRGEILSIEKDSDHMNNAWEIWIKIDDDAYAYYLFDCNDWVIQC